MALGFQGAFEWFGDRLRNTVDSIVDSRMREAGQIGLATAQELAPKRTGYLESTIGFTYDQSRKLLQLYADASYGLWVEAGTRFMMAQPYLRPAVNAMGRTWGGSVEIQFANTPQLVGTYRPSNKKAVEHNRATTLKFRNTRAGKAKIVARHGHWNGPQGTPWERTWNQVPAVATSGWR